MTPDPVVADPPPVYLDCDTGIDDALAIAYLVASPRAELLGIGTVSGNVDSATSARNTLDLLALLGREDVPVAVGAHDPLVGAFPGGAPRVHGDNGIGDVELPRAGASPVAESAAELLVRLAHERAGRLRVVATGTLTNLALALRLEPRLPELVDRVVVMGGAAMVPGNITADAEANIHKDPEAAAEVLAASWPVVLVPLDVTMEHRLTESQRMRIAALDHPAAPYLAAMLERYAAFYTEVFGEPSCAMHDPLAVAVALDAVALGSAPVVRASVETGHGPARGRTVCDLRGRFRGFPEQPDARCRVVLSLAEEFSPHLLETLRRLERRGAAAVDAPAAPPEAAGRPVLVVVGSVNVDVTATAARLPAPGETVGGASLERRPGGKGANQAVAAARLGARSRFVGAVGRDADGDAMREALVAAGVDASLVAGVEAPTGTALVIIDARGENQIVVCPGANAHVDLADVEFHDDEAVLCQLEIDLAVVEEAARRHRGFFALNAAPARRLPASLVERCDLVIVNETEYAALPELAGAELVAVTYGERGSALLRRGVEVARAPGVRARVVDTVGAGDAFCAALVLALRSGLDERTALETANAVGAAAVADPAAQPALDRLEAYRPA